jgi:hypothetical protein
LFPSVLETNGIRVPAWDIKTIPCSVAPPVTVLQLDMLLLLLQFVVPEIFLEPYVSIQIMLIDLASFFIRLPFVLVFDVVVAVFSSC